MAEEVTGQEPADATQVVTADTTTADTEQPKVFDADYVAKLRKEAAQYRRRAQELEQAQQQADAAKLGDVERLTKERDALKQQHDALLAQQHTFEVGRMVEKAAGKIGLDAELVAALIKTDDIDLEDEDTPKLIEKQMRALVQRYPYLAKTPDISPTNGGATGNKQALVFNASQLNDHSFYLKHKDEILKAQREGRIVVE